MKKIYKLLPIISLVASSAFAQFTIDGNMNEAGYTKIATKANTNSGFGPTIDVNGIYLGRDASNVYIGVSGKLDVTNANAISLWLNFSQLSGVAAGTNLKTTTGAEFTYMVNNFAADFETDYLFSINTGGQVDKCFVNAVNKVNSTASYLEDCGLMGIAISAGASTVFNSNVTFSFSNSGGATSGFEMKIPFSAIGVTSASTVQAFAVVVSSTGYFSDVTVPGNVTGGNLGSGGTGTFDQMLTMNFNTQAGGLYHSAAIALPVELTTFNAKAQSSNINLDWATASEKQSSHFDIERSADARNWATIGSVKAAGTSVRANTYTYADNAPLSNVNYYRLKQVDLGGKFEYSQVATAAIGKGKLKGVFPNPVKDKLNVIAGELSENATASIFDLSGKAVQTTRLNGGQIDVSNLNQGLYLLRVSDDSGQTSEHIRFVKN